MFKNTMTLFENGQKNPRGKTEERKEIVAKTEKSNISR